MFLTPNAVGNAELLIGGIDDTKFKGDLIFADQTGEGDWEVTSSQISVNGKTTTLLKKTRSIIFDSGTSNILFDTQTTNVSPPAPPRPQRTLTPFLFFNAYRRCTRSSRP